MPAMEGMDVLSIFFMGIHENFQQMFQFCFHDPSFNLHTVSRQEVTYNAQIIIIHPCTMHSGAERKDSTAAELYLV